MYCITAVTATVFLRTIRGRELGEHSFIRVAWNLLLCVVLVGVSFCLQLLWTFICLS